MDSRGDGIDVTRDRVIVVCTTYPDRATADDRSARIVASRAAACAQVDGPVASCYVWKGEIERGEEWRCTFKTSSVALVRCLAAVTASHPYDVPELIWETVSASAAYAAWVDEITSGEPDAGAGTDAP
jgi:periplasmic divalent cation tolerance protein